jgi:two-component system sensor histidine kinase ChiS
MVPPIQAHRGFVDKFIGDAIMALFDEATPDGALSAAVEEHRALDRFNEQRGGSPLAMGIGLHIGPLTLGVVGSEERLSCTVYGDSVNLASRVEGLTRAYGARILLTGETLGALADREAFECRYVDRVRVKGKERPVELWECLTALPEPERVTRAPDPAMEEARAPYQAGEFQEAVVRLAELRTLFPADPLLRVLLDRSREFLAHPPAHWDGVLRLDKK